MALEIRKHEDRVEILDDGQTVTQLFESRVPYLYPLPSPSGANLARHWPIEEGVDGEEKDHPHHRSMWFSHGSVNGYDFWAWSGKGHPEIRTRGVRELSADPESATFILDLDWVADGKIQLTETRTYRIRKADPDTWWIDLHSQLQPSGQDALLGDTKEGTCALRVDRTLRLKGAMARGGILDSEGRTDGDSWGKRSKWVAFHGPDEKGEPAVVAMLDHPSNLRFPSWWHARDYGLLAANPFGIHDFENGKAPGSGDYLLQQGETLNLRYRILLHHGTPDAASLEATWKDFAETDSSDPS